MTDSVDLMPYCLCINNVWKVGRKERVRSYRRWIRDFVAKAMGTQGDLQIWWTPTLPIIYVCNQKSGCSTIKHSLKSAQEHEYHRSGRTNFTRLNTHLSDDCLRNSGLSSRSCQSRLLISCVRNPYTRALSGYLDMVEGRNAKQYPELQRHRVGCFEEHLSILAETRARTMNQHFRPQHMNLGVPDLTYDSIFFLENTPIMARVLGQVLPGFSLETRSPHSRDANLRLRHYTERAVELVRTIFAKDFTLFHYSQCLDEALVAPGAFLSNGRLCHTVDAHSADLPSRSSTPDKALKAAVRYRRLIDMRLI